MTNKDKKDSSCCGHEHNHKSTEAYKPLPLSTFHEELKKESPEFFKKMHDAKSDPTLFKSEQHFLDELHKYAPKLHEKLKSCNFKFKLDENTKKEWLNVIDKAGDVMQKLDALEASNGKSK